MTGNSARELRVQETQNFMINGNFDHKQNSWEKFFISIVPFLKRKYKIYTYLYQNINN